MIDLTQEQISIINRILASNVPGYEVWAFGSRINKSSSKHSDLDLAIISSDTIDWHVIEDLRDSFASSNLPFIVDVIDFSSLDDGIASGIKKEHVVIQQKK